MAYGSHRGRSMGRIMHYLYSMDGTADYWAVVGDGEVFASSTKIADYKWKGNTDFLEFIFNDEAKDYYTEAMKIVSIDIEKRNEAIDCSDMLGGYQE